MALGRKADHAEIRSTEEPVDGEGQEASKKKNEPVPHGLEYGLVPAVSQHIECLLTSEMFRGQGSRIGMLTSQEVLRAETESGVRTHRAESEPASQDEIDDARTEQYGEQDGSDLRCSRLHEQGAGRTNDGQTQTENGEPGGQKECHLERLVIQYARTFVLLGEAPVQLAEGKTIMLSKAFVLQNVGQF